jgi:pyruvate dehydrogenase E1 component alpha subunit
LSADGKPELLLALYRDMVRLRSFDERAVILHRQGRIGTYAISWGHEAIQAGAVAALNDEDWIFPSYRESAVGLLRGIPAATVLGWWRGHPDGWWDPTLNRVAPICVPVASHVPHAVGMAWAMRLRGDSSCALAFFGDGATSEGSFHEGMTFASAFAVPAVLVCNNNGWAISTPVERQSAAAELVDKAQGYGIPGVQVDGGDVIAVRDAVADAVDRARRGEGPTFIEARTYRMAPHATADDPSRYIDRQRVEREREQECVARFERRLRASGVLNDGVCEQIRVAANDELRSAIEAAESLGQPDPRMAFDTTYADTPDSVRRARAQQLGES